MGIFWEVKRQSFCHPIRVLMYRDHTKGIEKIYNIGGTSLGSVWACTRCAISSCTKAATTSRRRVVFQKILLFISKSPTWNR